MAVCLTLCRVRLGQDCRGRRPGILDAVHALRSGVALLRLTLLRGFDTHALCGTCVMRSMGAAVHGCCGPGVLRSMGVCRLYVRIGRV